MEYFEFKLIPRAEALSQSKWLSGVFDPIQAYSLISKVKFRKIWGYADY